MHDDSGGRDDYGERQTPVALDPHGSSIEIANLLQQRVRHGRVNTDTVTGLHQQMLNTVQQWCNDAVI